LGSSWRSSGEELESGEGGRTGERGGVGQHFFPVLEFVAERKLLLYVGEGREHDLAHVGEGNGFAKGDMVLRDSGKEFAGARG
jgi:hypothetical protein